MENKIKAIGYVRVSTDMQANKVFSSIEAQQNIISEYASNQGNYELVRIFNDTKSGKNMNRPAMQELIRFLKGNRIDVILSYRLDRISRDKFDYYGFEKFLKDNSVKLIYTNDINVDDSSSGEFFRDVSVAAASFERKRTAERVKEKYIQAVKAGYHPGGYPPLGYKHGDIPKTIEIDKNSEILVKNIYQWFLEERTPSEIALKINQIYGGSPVQKLKNGKIRGGSKYNESQIKRFLKNPIYAGYTYYKNEAGEYELFEGRHKAIINREIWHQVQEKFKQKKEEKGEVSRNVNLRDRNQYILKKILYCSCGYKMTVGTSGKKHKDGSPHTYYKCVQKRKLHSLCDCKTAISQTIIENVVFSCLGYVATKGITVNDLRLGDSEYKRGLIAEKEQLGSQKQKISQEIKKGTSKLIEIDDSIILDELKQQLKEKSAKLTEIIKRIDEINSEMELFKESFDLGRIQVEATLENIDALQAELTVAEKKMILQSVVKKMVINCIKVKNPKKYFSLTIFPKEEYYEKLGKVFEITFIVDNSLGKGFWEVTYPFKMKCDSNRNPLTPKSKRKRGRHCVHQILAWQKEISDGVSIREFAKERKIGKTMLLRKLQIVKNLSQEALEFVLKLRYLEDINKVTLRKLYAISELDNSLQLKALKKLVG